jgi:hypothetical protein
VYLPSMEEEIWHLQSRWKFRRKEMIHDKEALVLSFFVMLTFNPQSSILEYACHQFFVGVMRNRSCFLGQPICGWTVNYEAT